MDPRGPKNGRSKILPFLYSFGHTEAKKIPENFFLWYYWACFFSNSFLAKTHQEGPKIVFSKILAKWPEKNLVNSSIFFYNIKTGSKGKIFQVFFCLCMPITIQKRTNFWRAIILDLTGPFLAQCKTEADDGCFKRLPMSCMTGLKKWA